MEVLLSVLVMLVALMGLLVVGLLRSHAEILRRLDEMERGRLERADRPALLSAPGAEALPTPPAAALSEAHDIAGLSLGGDAVKVAVAGVSGRTLLAFLSSGCTSCGAFWDAFAGEAAARVPGGARVVIVSKDPELESSSRLRDLAPDRVPLVMSSDAWERYRVAGSPYFVLVDGPTSSVLGEGTAATWTQVAGLLGDALADHEPRDASPGERAGAQKRLARADGELAAAGIGPGHPSLYGEAGGSP